MLKYVSLAFRCLLSSYFSGICGVHLSWNALLLTRAEMGDNRWGNISLIQNRTVLQPKTAYSTELISILSISINILFGSFVNQYIQQSYVRYLVVVYDVTRRETFANLSDVWAKEVELYSTNKDCVKMLIGNKVDRVSFLLSLVFSRSPQNV